MQSHPFAAELDTALRAAAEAAKLLRSRAGADVIREKGRADLVTQVDEESERLIERHLRATFPEDAFIAEEFSAAASSDGRRWIVDPLDGTVNFVHGHPFACVSIALVDENGPAVAVVDAPFLGEIYHAVRGVGAFLNDARIVVSDVRHISEALLGTGFPFKPGKGNPGPYMEMVGDLVVRSHGVRRAGAAALDLSFVACGRLDAYFEIGLSPWDIAAGLLLVAEAGGRVSGFPGDSQPSLVTGRIIATNGHIHDAVTAALQAHVRRL
jgi:myo-inositol-1(or 4)-monophosphatase